MVRTRFVTFATGRCASAPADARFCADRLDASQHSVGFLTQSAFTGIGQTLAYLTPITLLFLIGSTPSTIATLIFAMPAANV